MQLFAAEAAVVSIVSVVAAAVPLGVTDAGAKVHVDSMGNPEQLKVTT